MKTYLYTNVQSSISHNRQKLEIIQISISWWVDKDHVVYPCGCCSVTQSCPALCNTMDCSTPDFFVLDCLLEFSLTHVHWVNNAIQPSHSPSPPSPPALNLSQHQGHFQRVGQSIGVSASASVLPMTIQGWFRLGMTGLISLLSKEFSKVFSSITVQKHQFFGAQPSLLSNSHIHTWLLEKS